MIDLRARRHEARTRDARLRVLVADLGIARSLKAPTAAEISAFTRATKHGPLPASTVPAITASSPRVRASAPTS